MMGWGSQGNGMGGFGWIAMVFFWIFIVAGIVLLVRYLSTGHGSGTAAGKDRDPMQVLKERYARGEIRTEEYKERRKVLESGQ
jgi:putative membrane protein